MMSLISCTLKRYKLMITSNKKVLRMLGHMLFDNFYHHPNLQSISSCIYILDPYEGMTQEVRTRIKAEEESEANRGKRSQE